MRNAFIEYLAAIGVLSPDKQDRLQTVIRTTREPIGSIALSYGLISAWDVESILEEQRACYRPFGEIAVEKGLLTSAQVEMLLLVQRLRASTEVAEALALSGVCPAEEVVSHFGRFLAMNDSQVPCIPG
ncbi:MAG: hypothetical protein PVJ57_02710 [Phycisphaerae bacterium]|jgi:hypothetical protein